MRKKLAVTAMVAMCTIGMLLTGCGKSEAENDNVIKIGWLSDMSGDYAMTGQIRAAQMAVEEINADGGINGKQIEFINYDTQSDNQRYQDMAKKLINEDKVDVTFMVGTSASRESIRPIYEESKSILFYASNYEGGVASKYVFCNGGVPEQQIQPLMEYVGNNVGKTMYLVLADYNYGHISEGFIQQYAAENGIEIVGEEYIPMSVSQFSSTISNIQQLQPDIVYTLLVGSPQLSFFTQWAAAGVDDITIVSNCNVGGMNHEHTTLQAPSMAGAVGVTNFMDELKYSDDKAEEFVSKFNQKYPDEAYVYNECATSYDAIYLYAAAVEKAGSADTDEVIKAFETGEVSFDGPDGMHTMDGATHHASNEMHIIGINEDHSVTELKNMGEIQPSYLNSLGVDLKVEDPRKQYSPIEE